MAVRLWTAFPRRVFHINPDEPGQLAIARLFGRGANWEMLDHSTWRPAYGMLIAPLSWLSIDPVVTYRVALALNAVLGGLSCVLLIWLARRLLDVSWAWCIVAAVAASLAPAVLFATDWAWSESLVQTTFLCFVVAALRFHDAASPGWGVAMVLAAAAGFATHSRLLVLSVVAAGVIVTDLAQRRLRAWTAAALLGAVVVLLAAVDAFSDLVVARVWDEPSTRNTAGSLVDRLGSGLSLVTAAAGQLWYQLVATLGLGALGAFVLARRSVGLDIASCGRRAADARIVLGATLPLVGLSIVFMADRWRPDQVVYGRYTDAVIAPLLVVGIGWLLTATVRSVTVALVAVAIAIVVTAVLVEATDRGQLAATGLVRAMVIGLVAFVGRETAIDVVAVTVAALAALLAIGIGRRLCRANGHLAVGLLLAVVLPVGYVRTRSVLDSGLNSWSSAAAVRTTDELLPDGGVVQVRFVPDSEDPAVSLAQQRLRIALYRFYLPDTLLVVDDGAAAVAGFTFAPVDHASMATRGASIVWRDPSVAMALWHDPRAPPSSSSDH